MSSSCVEILKACKNRGITIGVVDGKLKVLDPQKNLDKSLLSSIKANKDALIRVLGQGEDFTKSDFKNARLTDDEFNHIQSSNPNLANLYIATPMQAGLIFHGLLDETGGFYNIQSYFELNGSVDVCAMQAAWQKVLERHDILRSCFVGIESEQIHQLVQKKVELPFVFEDWQDLDEQEKSLRFDALLSNDNAAGYDFAKAPLMRISLIRFAKDSYHFLWSHHHALLDGWCIPIIFNEVMVHYQALLTNKPVQLAPAVAYEHYVEWLLKQDQQKADRFWKEHLEGIIAPTPILLDPPEQDTLPTGSAKCGIELTEEVSERLVQLARQSHSTLNVVVQAAWAFLLSSYSGETDVVFGTTVSGRPPELPGVEQMMGLFINTIPVRINIDEDAILSQLLDGIHRDNLARNENSYMSLSEIQRHSELDNGTALFDSLFIFENLPDEVESDGDEEEENPLGFAIKKSADDSRTNYKILLTSGLKKRKLKCDIHFQPHIVTHESASNLLAQLELVLNTMANVGGDLPLKSLSIISEKETEHLLYELNQTQANFPDEELIHELFEKQATLVPDNTAVIYDGKTFSYQELNEASNQLAHYLRGQGVNTESLVGISIRRSFDMLVGILAVLKSGGAYVPLDPGYPSARLQHMLDDTGLKHLLSSSDLISDFSEGVNISDDIRITLLDTENCQQELQDLPKSNLQNHQSQDSNSLAYVIYTSGSTGQPKGVMNTHRNVSNFLNFAHRVFMPSHIEGAVVSSTLSFDATVGSLYPPLLCGRYVELLDDDENVLANLEKCLLQDNRSLMFKITPAHLEAIASNHLAQKNKVSQHVLVIAGEQLLARNLSKWKNELLTSSTFINEYGPTEGTVGSSTFHGVDNLVLSDNSKGAIPIGRPLENVSFYVLDEKQQLVPKGAVGELFIGGDGVARGYLNRDDLTQERFIQNPFSQVPGDRLYKTGDLVRYLIDGNLQFIGRIDEQVNIRGFRVELGEIEYQLSALENINSAVVLAKEELSGHIQIFAYVIPEKSDGFDEQSFIQEVRLALGKSLPNYMMPSAFVLMSQWPLTPNGKVDKKALPESGAISLQGDFIAPETETEKTLTTIWAKTLKLAPEDISITANFFDLGGHSLLAVRLIAEIRSQLKQEMPYKTIFESPDIKSLSLAIDAGTNVPLRKDITKVERLSDKLPLSFAQQRLWFIDQLQGGSTEYNMPAAMGIEGDFNIQAAEQAIANIIQRHEPLRTIFLEENDSPVQVVQKEFDFQLTQIDLRDIDGEKQAQKVKSLIQKHSHRAFDLSQELMVRGAYLHLAGEGESQEGILLFNMHHIASDGWSMGILVKEFISLYEAELAGQPDPLPALEIQYADYAHWQKHWLEGEVLDGQLDYWTKQLEEIPSVHSLPLDFIRPDNKQHQGEIVVGRLSPETSQALAQIANDNKVTLFMLLHAAIALVLSRHSHSQDIVLGTPVANRMQAELEPLIGFFVNTLVLRVNTEYDAFSDYLAHVKAINLEAQANQDVPFEHLVEHCKVARSTQHSPLFQIIFNMDTNEKSELSLPGIRISPVAGGETVAKFDLDINAVMSDDGLHFCWTYDKSLFKPKTIERLNDHLERVLMEVVDDPSLRLRDIAMLSEQEVHHLVHDLNDTQVDYPKDKLIHELFEGQAEETPDNIALVFNDEQLTYRELNEASNRLAHYLIAQGVTTETLIGLSVERSLTMVIGILGILKAGGAYVPLDPSYPTERLQYMLQDSDLHYLLTEQGLTDGLQLSDTLQLINYDADIFQTELSAYPLSNPERKEKQCSSNLAYIIYTSGSTGLPKGVMVEHGNVHRLFQATEAQFQFNSDDVWTLFHSYAFDFSVWELWGALLYGGRLVIVPWLTTRSSQAFYQLLHEQEVTILNQTPSAFQSLIEIDGEQTLPLKLRRVIFGGEALELASLKPWVARHGDDSPQLVNMYGITETTVHVTYRRLFKTEIEGPVSASLIGQPLSDLSVYLLTPELMLTPLGSVGELYVGGSGLSRGYLAKAELTAERFIQNPLSDEPNERLYKTGDLARYNANGELEFIGRIDDQVKIRGFRIELGEIEHHLSHCDNVASSLVLVREDESGEKYLVAYLIADNQETLDVNGLRQSLQATLPDYMLPAAFVVVKEWPLTANGKIDKKALPAPDGTSLQGEYIAPETQTEKTLVAIWAKLLHLPAENISVTANFFELGGHSLLTVRLIAEIRSQLKQELPLEDIFKSPDIQRLSMIVDAGSNVPLRKSVTKIVRSSHQLPLSFAQQRLWFIDQLQGGSAEYNMPMALRTEGDFDVSAAEQAIRNIIQRHEPLRTILVEDDEGPSQIIRTKFDFSLKRHDLRQLKSDAQDAKVQELVAADSVQAFNLSKDLMVRASYLHLAGAGETQEGILLFNMHHIASDGWSMGILVKEFIAQYQAALAGHSDPLPALEIQYADYAHWQRDWLEGEVLEGQLNYWQQQLDEVPVVHSLSLDYPRPETKKHIGGGVNSVLPAELSQALRQRASAEGVTPFMLVHAAIALVLSRHSHSHDIVLGTPVANRMQVELEPLIGFFVNTLVLRVNTEFDTLSDYLAHVKSTNLDAQANQDVPFEQLVEHCKVARSTQHSPLFQIMFSMNTNEESELSLPGVNFSPVDSAGIVAKFDLDINAVVADEGIYLRWTYDKSLFKQATVERLNTNLERVLMEMVTKPDLSLRDIAMLSEQEIKHLTHELNDNQAEYPKDKLIHELFEAQVAKTPDNIALVFNDEQLTYRELNEASNRLAHYLREKGVNTGSLVGLCFESGLATNISILAILKAGGAYVPLDPNYPQARLQYMLEDSGLKFLVSQKGLCNGLKLSDELALIEYDSRQQLIRYPVSNLDCDAQQSKQQLAYVIYTSGSTGQPKGVMIPHLAVVRLVINPSFMTLDYHTRFLQAAPVSFDAATLELWGPLLNGGCCVVYAGSALDFNTLNATIIEQAVNSIWLTAGLFEQWSEVAADAQSLRWILAGGDIVNPAAVSRVQSALPDANLINGYGPTENTTFSCCYTIPRVENVGQSIPIGSAINGTQLYIASAHDNLVPVGCVGELWLGGEGLALGYLNQEELTRERFIQNPFSDDLNARLYKTGDLVKYLADGSLAFVGRKDEQVKVRGFRVEPGEVENQLVAFDNISSALVVAQDDELGQKCLVAYVLPEEYEAFDINETKQSLQQTLPAYMLPSAFVVVKEWPLTANGKIDKKALPAPDGTSLQGEYIAPETQTEKTLVAIWAKLLHLPAENISVTANFFDLGGHSLLTVRLVAEIRSQLKQELAIREIFESPDIRSLSAIVDTGCNGRLRMAVTAMARSGNKLAPSFAQQRLWFIDQLQGGSAEYNMPMALRTEGDFDVSAAEQAIRTIIQRHEPLRTILVEDDEGPSQIIRTKFDFSLKRHDLRQLKSDAQETKIQELVAADSIQAFNLSKDLMVRAAYLHLAGAGETQEGILLFNMHHIASDGWSMGILVKEFIAQYQAALAGHSDPLPALEIQYADYAHWQRDWLEGEVLEGQLNYWQQQLEDVPVVHSLSLDYPRPETKKHIGGGVNSVLPAELSQALRQRASAEGVTPFMLVHAAIALVLSRHSHSHDIVLGTPVANRMQVELEPLIGFFVNTLVLRVNTEFDTLSDYLAHVKSTNLDAQANQDVPFEQLVEHCKVARSTQHSPLFQIMFSMNTNEESELSLPGVNFSPVDSAGIVAKFDLDINAVVADEGIYLRWTYDKSLFKQATVERLNTNLERVLMEMVTKPDLSLRDIAMLSEQEIKHLTHELNDNQAEYPKDKLIHELFEAQVAKTPDNIALVFNDEQLTYRELNEASNRLAHYLVEQGVEAETLVGLCVERSLEMMIGILGILKAGGAYVPMDPGYPKARLQHIVDDTNLKHLLSQSSLAGLLTFEADVNILEFDSKACREQLQRFSCQDLPRDKKQNIQNLAYVIYTSGSTGLPKGVMVEHLGLYCLAKEISSWELCSDDQAWGWSVSFAFDSSLKAITQLMMGRPLVVLSDEIRRDPLSLKKWIKNHNIGVMDCTPSMVEMWFGSGLGDVLPNLLIGGESISADLWSQLVAWQTEERKSWNVYGPTECTVNSTQCQIVGAHPHIGRRLNHVKLYLLGVHQQLTPLGAVGELCVGGDGVARGYLNQLELTEASFIRNPFSKNPSDRLYKTGDLARFLPDGNLEFIGRIDEQVKIRGYRIELAEIENQLTSLENIQSSIVLAREEEPGQKRLVAYVLPEECEAFDINETKQSLQQTLPAYMLPSAFVVVKEWPLTANGKIDKKALPAPDGTSLQGEYIAPETQTEKMLVAIWAKLLHLPAENISVTANFFDLGGHSLLTVRLVAEIRSQLKQELAIREIFESPDIRSLSAIVDTGSNGRLRMAVTAMARSGNKLAPSFAQQRLWFIDQLQGGSAEYNMPMALRTEGDFDVSAAEQAIRTIIQRHEPLRTILVEDDEGPSQIIRTKFDFSLKRHDLRQLKSDAQETKIQELVAADSVQAFNLSKDLMVRASYLHLAGAGETQEGILLFNMHHIASDGWSMGILVKEFIAQYQAALAGHSDPLPALEIQYADYAHWQRDWLEGEVLEGQLNYWQQQLDEVPAVHSLSLDYPRPETKKHIGGGVNSVLPAELSQALRQRASAEGVTPFMLVHAAIALVLSRHSHSHDIVLGTPVANRMQVELEPLIGFFVNTLVLRVNTEFDTLSDYLAHVKSTNLDAQANQDVPFEQLVEHCKVARSTQHSPLFQIMFSMNTNEESELSLPGVNFSPVDSTGIVAKFDLDINAVVADEGIYLRWTYDKSLFKQATVERLNTNLERVLMEMVTKPDLSLRDIAMLSEQEIKHLTHELNDNQAEYPKDKLIHELFEAQVAKTPDNIALVFNDEQLTYRELNEASNRLAHYLVEQGVEAETLVGLCVERSLEMMIGILGILKAGGAYVPMDPDYPKDRLQRLLKDAGLKHLLTQESVAEALELSPDLDIFEFNLEDCQQVLQNHSSCNLELRDSLVPESLAYVIYTSGSTGQPKGVPINHQSLSNYLHHAQTHYLTPVVGSVVSSSLCFDATITTLFTPLCVGKSVELLVDNNETMEALCERLFQSEKPLLFKITPAHLDALEHHRLAESFCNVAHQIVVGGEQWNLGSLQLWKGKYLPSATFVNEYGPTETVVGCCTYSVTDQKELKELTNHAVPIGRCIQNVQLYVLDTKQQLQPFHSTGELYIGGDGVATGYLNRANLTEERFIQNPFSDDVNDRLYKTGDLVRYLPDAEGNPSNLEFIGRIDDQVKIRGFRIELGDIEHHIAILENIKSAVVMERENESAHKTLVAYVIAESNQVIDKEALKQSLQLTLPNYMVPAVYIVMKAWPLTPNGKIDRKALPAPDFSVMQDKYIAPETASEKMLASIWANILKLEVKNISLNANFFELGGHSLLLFSMIRNLEKCGFDSVGIKQVYENQTLKSLAAVIEHMNLPQLGAEQSIVKLNDARTKQKLFVFHPFSGRIDDYLELANSLKPTTQVFAVQAPYLYQHNIKFNSLIEIAEYYVAGIKNIQATGPYRLSGWSIGGEIAYYVAYVLQQSGEEVEYLSMFDPKIDNVQLSFIQSLEQVLSLILPQDEASRLMDTVNKQPSEVLMVESAAKRLAELNIPGFEKVDTVSEISFALKQVLNFIVAERPQVSLQSIASVRLIMPSDRKDKVNYSTKWKKQFACNITASVVEGTHYGLMTGESLQQIANFLNEDANERSLKKQIAPAQ